MTAGLRRLPDAVVIGAGITGAAAALALAEAGARVMLLDRWFPAAMASGWTLAGVRQSGRDPAELPLARAAVAQWATLHERLGGETGYVRGGNLRLARNEAEVAVIRALVETQRAAGLELDFLPDTAAVRAVAPALSESVLAASFCPSDGHADPVATVGAFVAAAERRSVRVLRGVAAEGLRVEGLRVGRGRVTAVETAEGPVPAGAVVAAPGVEVNALLAPLGLSIPLRRPIVTVLRTEPLPPLLGPVLGVANADLAVRQERDGRLRATSGADDWQGALGVEDGRPVARPAAGRLGETVARVSAVLPAFAGAPLAAFWGGVLDLTPDALPVIDRAPGIDNLVVAAGFSGHGFAIGPVTGPLAAALALGEAPAFDAAPFRFARFAAGAPASPLTLHG